MQQEEVIIVGAGPCGMAAAIALQEKGINPLIIEKENIVNSLYRFPTHQTFFSSSDKLEIGNVAFITEKQRPVRNEALTYYREVAKRKELRIHSFEEVIHIEKDNKGFTVQTENRNQATKEYKAKFVIIATGYYDQPNWMGIPGEELSKVSHYFKEAHPYYDKNVVVIGGKNSAVDAALELHKAGAHVTVMYRGDKYSKSVKPWILPGFDSLVQKGEISMIFNAHVTEITEQEVYYHVAGVEDKIPNDYVFAMTGYQPDIKFLNQVGVHTDEQTGIPMYDDETYETNVPGLYIAGVVAAGFNNNAIFIENGRFHGEAIAESIAALHSSKV
ncbi:YpdA family putative bacillithiol disulfide reductase [Oceanobacillus luteolus]|uniref:YpdA family putative bacillithiol disulfide reductase n=1 Tax=Oceanobacillus luteolus TaxID=1274358 RepID=A0ABW4HTB7_9BACI|nr:YpdA family putative bacillithiol disulfide reductase [Oceanobacillus luteolus]MCM3738840.1 YpdA family putative bacillithiol disulfide reductase [Oceanobacillus luteolus]